MANLRFLAGTDAYQTLMEQGLKPDHFTQLLAASGGPKWLGIAGLDKYLFGEFFKQRQTPLYTLGASSGAWRLACLAQADPLAAYQRLEQLYIGQRYETRPSREEVSRQVRGIVSGILGSSGTEEILKQPHIRSHIVVCRARHLNGAGSKLALAAGLGITAMTNLVSRRTLGWHFERLVFASAIEGSPFAQLKDLPGDSALLSSDNIQAVLLATGSIPLLLSPVTEISGVTNGHFYDGGITDYHFDLPLSQAPGLTLYPHFYPHMAPGWFDKSLPWRRAKRRYHNALLLAPTEEFVASLPYGKIPDRKDFETLDSASRIQYWRRAADISNRLADEFAEVFLGGKIAQRLELL